MIRQPPLSHHLLNIFLSFLFCFILFLCFYYFFFGFECHRADLIYLLDRYIIVCYQLNNDYVL